MPNNVFYAYVQEGGKSRSKSPSRKSSQTGGKSRSKSPAKRTTTQSGGKSRSKSPSRKPRSRKQRGGGEGATSLPMQWYNPDAPKPQAVMSADEVVTPSVGKISANQMPDSNLAPFNTNANAPLPTQSGGAKKRSKSPKKKKRSKSPKRK